MSAALKNAPFHEEAARSGNYHLGEFERIGSNSLFLFPFADNKNRLPGGNFRNDKATVAV